MTKYSTLVAFITGSLIFSFDVLNSTTCGRLENSLKRSSKTSSMKPGNVTLHGIRGNCRCDSVKDLEMEKAAWLIKVVPKCNHRCSYKWRLRVI